MGHRLAVGRAACLIAIGVVLALPAGAGAASPSVDVPGPAAQIRVDAASGELANAGVTVRGATGRLSVRLEDGSAPLLRQGLTVLRLVTTQVGGRAIADPLPPLVQAATVAGTAPVRVVLRFRVPDATPAGVYEGRLAFAVDGRRFERVAVRLRVFGVQLPARNDPTAFRTLFLIQPQTYAAAVAARAGLEPAGVGPDITDRLYSFLSDYRISPGDWGFGTPWPDGYVDRTGWHRAAASRMASAGSYPFRTMRLPLGTQRSAASRTGQSARSPETWAGYLTQQVLPFWRRQRVARPRARVGMGRGRAGLRSPVRRTAGVRVARRRGARI